MIAPLELMGPMGPLEPEPMEPMEPLPMEPLELMGVRLPTRPSQFWRYTAWFQLLFFSDNRTVQRLSGRCEKLHNFRNDLAEWSCMNSVTKLKGLQRHVT